jgi:hypothetical protein
MDSLKNRFNSRRSDLEENATVSEEFIQSIKSMHVTSQEPKRTWPLHGVGGKDWVSLIWDRHDYGGGVYQERLSARKGFDRMRGSMKGSLE